MIVQHPSFEYIPEDTVLWQYMSLTKFLYLIMFRQLHLHRIDNLMDKEEGKLSENNRKRVFISCWIKHPVVISQMWYSYGKDEVAIRMFLIGLLSGLSFGGNISPSTRLILVTGFCGGFTTFSTFMNENLLLGREGSMLFAVLYTLASLALGLIAVLLGYQIVK